MGRGMQMLCKMYGALDFNIKGKKTRFVWNYHTEQAINETEMTKDMWVLSEKAKYAQTQKAIENLKPKKGR